ncbi:MAG: protein translocase subunit SecF [Clostridia bacterium]|nr:protein translocase subunit SecF [Clostridia bacterium]
MKKRFTGNTRLYLCISGAIIAVALIMQLVGVGMNLGIDFTGGSILSYSVGEDYDVNDVITILQSAGYTDQPQKAAPSEASIRLQEKLAADAAAEAAAAAEDAAAEAAETEAAEDAAEEASESAEAAEDTEAGAAEDTAAEAAETETAEDAAEDTAAEAAGEPAEEETFVPMLNMDKSGIASDGLTDLQIRLKLADATKGMEETVAKAVQSVVSGAKQTSYRTATNLEVSDLGYDLSYAGGKIIEFSMGGDYDKDAVAGAVNAALKEGGFSLNEIQFARYDAAAEAARIEAEEAAIEEAEAEEAETEGTEGEGEEEAEAAEEAETEATADAEPEAVEEAGSDLRILINVDDVTSQVRTMLEREMTAKYPNFRFISVDHVSAIAGRDLLSNAIKALLIAFVCMLIYIAIRFSPLSGAAALFALLHDILIMCAFMVFFRFAFQVNSSFIAAILTIVGYSINNTIIIFDRIREDRKKPGLSQMDMMDIVEVSVSTTLSRTINTTLTTLITLVCLFIFGVSSIREFAFPLIIGMLAGTYSSVLLSGQVWAMWDKKLGARRAAKQVK